MGKSKIKVPSKAGMMRSNGDYEWKFSTFGGVTRVNVSTGEDIAHLDELDQKLWTVLSCPATGLEMDAETLGLLDLDGDGKIHVNEILETVAWLKSVLADMSVLVDKSTKLNVSAIRTDSEESALIHDCALRLLKHKKSGEQAVSLQDVTDRESIFAGTKFNGDGVITAESAEDDELKTIIADCIATMGAVPDRSGADGIDSAKLDAFYAAVNALYAWQKAETEEIYVYGDDTAAALAAKNAIKDKIADFFMRCSLARFSPDSTVILDVSAAQIGGISEKNLTDCKADIASYPIARVNPDGKLDLNGINPAWQPAFSTFRTLVLDKEYPEARELTEEQWKSCASKLDAYETYVTSKAGSEVEGLGKERVKAIAEGNRKDDIAALIEKDVRLAKEIGAIRQLRKLLLLHRDFYRLLRNYVTFSDFYTTDKSVKAVFQAGKLYIDQRCCELCVKVTDMAAQTAMAGHSEMYLLYCDCVAKHSPAKMTIVAVMTDGDIANLKVGTHAVFYDRQGNDYDATVTKIIDNPISIRQAFWSPYRKMGSFIESSINKFAAKQDSKVMEKATAGISNAGQNATTPQQPAAFDVSKFAGIFAMIGMALGSIGTFLASTLATISNMGWIQLIATIAGIILLISGPSMIMAWLRLRKRNLAPILNANGWAINSNVIVNVAFGQKLTTIAKMPTFVGNDPFADKKMPAWKKALIWIAVIIVIAVGVYFLLPKDIRPFWPEAKTGTEVEAPAETVAEVPADTVEITSAE